jgi:hypothetical protein
MKLFLCCRVCLVIDGAAGQVGGGDGRLILLAGCCGVLLAAASTQSAGCLTGWHPKWHWASKAVTFGCRLLVAES